MTAEPFLSLARKWRPRRLSDMAGHEFTVRALQNAVRQNRLHHAFLFTGTRGVGKTSLARILATLVNCESPADGEPCLECGACRAIIAGRFPDVIEVDAASHTGKDEMVELLAGVKYVPAAGKYKVLIIDEVHMLSKHAFNAMLKILEEPPPHLKFILATTDPEKIPATIISRCLSFELSPLTRELIREQLARILTAEGHEYGEGAVREVARLARGSLRDGLSILDQAIAHSRGRLSAADVRRMVNEPDTAVLRDVLKAVADSDAARIAELAAALNAGHFSFEVALMRLAGLLFKAALLKAVSDADMDDADDEAAAREAGQWFSPEELQLLYEIAVRGRQQLPFAPDERTGFEMTLLRMMLFAPADVARAEFASPPAANKTTTPVAAIRRGDEKAASGAEPVAARPEGEQAVAGCSAIDRRWRETVEKLGEATRGLTDNCAVRRFDENGVILVLDKSKANAALLLPQLKTQLRRLHGDDFSVTLENADNDAQSDARARREMAAARATPFVKEMLDAVPEARLQMDSIRLLGGEAQEHGAQE